MLRLLITAILLGFFVGSTLAQDVAPGSTTTVAPQPAIPENSGLRPDSEHHVPLSNDGEEIRQLPQLPQSPVLPEEPALPARPAR